MTRARLIVLMLIPAKFYPAQMLGLVVKEYLSLILYIMSEQEHGMDMMVYLLGDKHLFVMDLVAQEAELILGRHLRMPIPKLILIGWLMVY